MNARFLILSVSLVANIALGFYYANRPASAGPAAPLRPAGPAAPAPAGPKQIPLDEKTWSRLAQGDDPALAGRLRAEGFPPNMVFALVSLRQRERHAGALAKFRRTADIAYWRKGPYEDDDVSPEDRAARRALDRQMAAELKELLGADSDLATIYQQANRERIYGNLAAEKIDQVNAINRDYGEIAALVRDRSKGVTLQEDRDQLALIERERRADLARLLTPQELLEYDLRSSPSAATVRSQLRNFDATEEEYRALVSLQLAFDATYGNRTNLSGEQQQRRNEAAVALTAQIKSLLSPERFAEYEVKTDQTYSWIAGMISQYKSPANPSAVVSAQRELAQRFNALRGNRALAPAVRDAQLDVLSAEANSRMAATLGPEAFKMYKFNGGPINALLNRPAPKP